jgi:hypothetical protein
LSKGDFVRLALPLDVTGRAVFGPSNSTGRVHQALVAGVALVGAGLVAVGPSAPSLPDIQHRAVQLSSTGAGLVDPASVFSTAYENLQTLAAALEANPSPVVDQLIALNQAYENQINMALQGVETGLEKAINGFISSHGNFHAGLAETLQTITTYLQQGDLFDAYATFDGYSLEALEQITKPLGTILAIPGEISQTFTNVLNSELTFNSLSNLVEGFTAPSITETIEATQVFDAIEADLAAGNATAAFTDITNAPTELLGAYLNGAEFDFGMGPFEFPGLLSFATAAGEEAGGLQQLLLNIPEQLATALGATSTDTASTLTHFLDPNLPTDITSMMDPTSLLGVT